MVNVTCYIYSRLGRIPKRIKVDNDSEFISKALDNGSFRDECLNASWFMSLEDVREKIENWRKGYNEFRPHSALNNMTSNQFSTSLRKLVFQEKKQENSGNYSNSPCPENR